MKPTIYVSKRCGPCRKLLMMLQQRPYLKGHYQIICIDDSPFPKAVRTVPCMIIDDTIVNSEKLFAYILNSDTEKNNGQTTQSAQEPQKPQKTECSVEEITGMCSGGSCLNFASIDEDDTSLTETYSFINEDTPQNISTTSEQGSEKRDKLDNDYERLMSERGELMSKPSFA